MAALGRPGYINLSRDSHLSSRTVEGMQSQANAVMDELFAQCRRLNDDANRNTEDNNEKYVPWLDCARSYGLSEKFVGEYLRSNDVSPSSVRVSSKWGYTYVADWNVALKEGEPHEVKDHSLENFLKQVEETKECIGPYLNLYQVHSATFDSGILTDTDVHDALHRICHVENGWDIGLSVSGPNQDEIIRAAMKITVGGENEGDTKRRRLFDSVQCTYNVLEQRPGLALMEAKSAGMDVIIKEGMANGRALQHAALGEAAKSLDCGADQLALGAILAQPFRPRVLSGAVSVEQLRSNLGALYPINNEDDGASSKGVEEKLTATEVGRRGLDIVMDKCRTGSEEYWKERGEMKWN